jgi:hypothetical protein
VFSDQIDTLSYAVQEIAKGIREIVYGPEIWV